MKIGILKPWVKVQNVNDFFLFPLLILPTSIGICPKIAHTNPIPVPSSRAFYGDIQGHIPGKLLGNIEANI